MLTSHPQEFCTFGGHDAGNLLGIERARRPAGDLRPEIGGRRDRGGGLDASRAHLDQAPRPGPVAARRTPTGWSASPPSTGSTTGWWSPATRWAWPAASPSGRRSGWVRRTGRGRRPCCRSPTTCHRPPASCPGRPRSPARTAPACWVAGWVRGRAAIWPVTIGADGAITAAQPSLLPGTPPQAGDPTALVTLVAGRPLVSTGAATPGLQLGLPQRLAVPHPAGGCGHAAAGVGVRGVRDHRRHAAAAGTAVLLTGAAARNCQRRVLASAL